MIDIDELPSASIHWGLGTTREKYEKRRSTKPEFKTFSGRTCQEVTWSLDTPNLNTCSKDDLKLYLENTRDLYETLFSSLKNESTFYLVPNELRRPLIFYYGHTAVFYVNKLILAGFWTDDDRIDPKLEDILAVGVDEMSWDDMNNESFEWPSVAKVAEYRDLVNEKLFRLLDSITDWPLPIVWNTPHWAFFMGAEHARIHLETSSVLIRQLPLNKVVSPLTWNTSPTNMTEFPGPSNELLTVDKGEIILGKKRDFPCYGWDNEYGQQKVIVQQFKAFKYAVTNGEFLPFVESGAYFDKIWWICADGDDEGWRWIQHSQADCPTFWRKSLDAKFRTSRLRIMFHEIDMPWDWPVECNYFEAMAFCRWKGSHDGLIYRTPTESEFHRMRGIGRVDGTSEPRDDDMKISNYIGRINNLALRHGSPSPVDSFSPSSIGFYDTQGNVWEWVEDNFSALPGFEVLPTYLDFSTPCFDSFHTLVMGGSWISTGNEATAFARYAFRRHFFQHLGFRMVVEDQKTVQRRIDLHAAHRHVSNTIFSEYSDLSTFQDANGDSIDINEFSDFSHEVPSNWISTAVHRKNIALSITNTNIHCSGDGDTNNANILIIGSEGSRLAFELCSYFSVVVGLEKDEELQRLALILKQHKQREFEHVVEGTIVYNALAKLPDDIPLDRVHFPKVAPHETGLIDSVASAGVFDCVVINDFSLTRSNNPRLLFTNAANNVRSCGGLLVIVSDFAWDVKVAPANNWLGGNRLNGENMYGRGVVSSLLRSLGFSLISSEKHFVVDQQQRNIVTVRNVVTLIFRQDTRVC